MPENSPSVWSEFVVAAHSDEEVIKKSRFTEAQMVRILRETGRELVPAAKRYGVSDQTIYAWRKKYGGGDVNDDQLGRWIEIFRRSRFTVLLAVNLGTHVAKRLLCLPARFPENA